MGKEEVTSDDENGDKNETVKVKPQNQYVKPQDEITELQQIPTVPPRKTKDSTMLKIYQDDSSDTKDQTFRNTSYENEIDEVLQGSKESQDDLTPTCCDENIVRNEIEIIPTVPSRRNKVQLCYNKGNEDSINIKEPESSDSIDSENHEEINSKTSETGRDAIDQENIYNLIQTAKEGKMDLHTDESDDNDEDEDQKKERIKSKDQLDSFIAMIQSRLNEVEMLKEKKIKENSQSVVEDEESLKDDFVEKKKEFRIRIKVPKETKTNDAENL